MPPPVCCTKAAGHTTAAHLSGAHTNRMPDDTPHLIYGFDPLCGWCYGLIPAMRRLREARPDLPVDLVCGGLVTGERVGPYRAMAGYVREASARMTATTGQPLSEAFFALIEGPDSPEHSGSAVPTRPILAIRERGDDALAYAHALQEAHFGDGLDLNAPDTHRAVAARLDIVAPPLEDLDSIDEHDPEIAAEFARARVLGIRSFPTLLAVIDGTPRPVPLDYAPDALVANVERALGLSPDHTPR